MGGCGQGRNARRTRCKAKLVEVELDSGAKIRCTPDHRFLLRDNTYRQARDLYRFGLPVLTQLRDSGSLQQAQAAKIEEAKRGLDRCEAILKSLNAL